AQVLSCLPRRPFSHRVFARAELSAGSEPSSLRTVLPAKDGEGSRKVVSPQDYPRGRPLPRCCLVSRGDRSPIACSPEPNYPPGANHPPCEPFSLLKTEKGHARSFRLRTTPEDVLCPGVVLSPAATVLPSRVRQSRIIRRER